MTTYELTRDQMIQLKQNYICELADEACEQVSYDDLANADELVPDALIHAYCDGTLFTADDFAA